MSLSTFPGAPEAPRTGHRDGAQIDSALRQKQHVGPALNRAWIWPIIFVVAAWLLTALLFHTQFYNVGAVLVGTSLLAGTLLFLVWQAPEGREDFRILGLFVCGQSFMASGMSVLSDVNPRDLRFLPTTEAFSFSVYSFALFTYLFLLGAHLTAPRRPGRPATARSGVPPGTALWLSAITAVVGIALAYGSRPDSVWRIGTLPGILFNPSLVVPLVLATGFATLRAHRLALGVVSLSVVVRSFLTSTLAGPIFFARDLLLTYAFFSKQPPWRWIAVTMVVIAVLNPAKSVFRSLQVESGDSAADAESWTRATELWGEALSATYASDDPRARERDQGEGSASRRLDYNHIGAHVYTVVPRKVAYQNGETYEDIPMMLVPRMLYPDKPTTAGHTRSRWLVRLGVQDPQSVHLAAVALPAPAEAYWNFGWLGLVLVPTAFGFFTGLLMRVRPEDPVERCAFTVLLVTTVAQFLDMLVWVIPQFIVVAFSTLLIAFFCWIGRAAFRPKTLRALHAPRH